MKAKWSVTRDRGRSFTSALPHPGHRTIHRSMAPFHSMGDSVTPVENNS
jgi:hypothetical protein